jgi:transposase-like protein
MRKNRRIYRISGETKIAIQKAHAEGLSIAQLAQRFSISRSSVYSALALTYKPPPPVLPPAPPEPPSPSTAKLFDADEALAELRTITDELLRKKQRAIVEDRFANLFAEFDLEACAGRLPRCWLRSCCRGKK